VVRRGFNASAWMLFALLLGLGGCAGSPELPKLPPSATRDNRASSTKPSAKPAPVRPPVANRTPPPAKPDATKPKPDAIRPRPEATKPTPEGTKPRPIAPPTERPAAERSSVAERPVAAPLPAPSVANTAAAPAAPRSRFGWFDLGYTQMAVDGDLALAPASGPAGTGQDIGSAFGLGDKQPSPLLRGGVDFGVLELDGSLFWLSESGDGTLTQAFGGIAPGTAVASDLDLAVAKFTATGAFRLGAVTIAPGLLVDVFDVDFTARELTLGNSEQIDELLLVPMPFVRLGASSGAFDFGLEAGFLSISRSGGSKGRFSDLEANVRWTAPAGWNLFAGYRRLGIDAEGDSGADNIEIDLSLAGWFIGGGLQF
jgi:hypothetical protein